jgi:hypothetical protein
MRRGVVLVKILMLFILISRGYTQSLHPSFISQQADIASYSSNHAELLSSVSNPASLTAIKNFSVVCAAERRYLLSGLNNYLIAAGMKLSSGYFGLTASYAGTPFYHESILSLAYARKLGKSVDIGLQLKYYQFSQGGGYGGSHTPGFLLGSVWHINEKLSSGIAIEYLSKYNYEWGIGYDASEQFFISFVVKKEEDEPVNVICGIKYVPAKAVFFKAGVNTAISSPWFAAGITLKRMTLEFFSSWHPMLGISPGMSIQFEQKSKLP